MVHCNQTTKNVLGASYIYKKSQGQLIHFIYIYIGVLYLFYF